MGHKSNPIGLRLQINRTWDSRWFAEGRDYARLLKEDIELRKYTDVARERQGDQLYLVTHEGETRMSLSGEVGYPFFGQLILDCLNRTENAMTQAHAFKAAELCLLAQAKAQVLS